MDFSISTMVQKVLKRVATVAVSGVVALNLDKFGININQDVAVLAVYGILESTRNVLKNKFNIKWL